MTTALWIARIVGVIALLGVAAAIATPKGRLPLALRGVRKIMRRDRGESGRECEEPVSGGKRFLAFLLILAAALIALV